ncbi:MAG: DUF4418 family protein [Eubacterium sp.]|nr:DUF4418 family protein [Eubacterium sp.]
MKNRVTVATLNVILGAFIALIPFVLFPVCNHDEKRMACYFTGKAEVVTGIAVAVLGIVYLVSKCKGIRIGITIAEIVNAVVVISFIKVIGLCKMATMACQVKTKPALIVASIILLVVQIANLVVLSKGHNDEKNSEIHSKEDKE